MHCSKVYSIGEFFQNCFTSIKRWRIGKIELSRGRINYFFLTSKRDFFLFPNFMQHGIDSKLLAVHFLYRIITICC